MIVAVERPHGPASEFNLYVDFADQRLCVRHEFITCKQPLAKLQPLVLQKSVRGVRQKIGSDRLRQRLSNNIIRCSGCCVTPTSVVGLHLLSQGNLLKSQLTLVGTRVEVNYLGPS
jgi:hypothetical protein